jgi:hypothetical protein
MNLKMRLLIIKHLRILRFMGRIAVIKDNMLVFFPGALDRFCPTPRGKLSPNGGRNAIASHAALRAAFPLSLARYPVIRGAILE